MKIEKIIVKLLIKKQKTLAVAESCSGGFISNRLTNICGSSKFFKVGIVAYSNSAKELFLKIPEKIIKKNGAVSRSTAILMAKNIRNLANVDFALSITGIAGPTGATKSKPVGLVYVAIATANKVICRKFNFKGSRYLIKKQAANAALNLLKCQLK